MVELADTHALGACRGIPCAGSTPVFGTNIFTTNTMFKKAIKPFQDGLLQRRLCVGCTYSLDKAQRVGILTENSDLVQCKCKRRYIYDRKLNQYRRASLQEEQQYLKGLKKQVKV